MAVSSIHSGWRYDSANSRLDFYYRGTRVGNIDASGLTAATGDLTVTTGDAHVVAQNLYMGAETAFASTAPTSAIVFKTGTQAAGAIVTSSALMANDTVLRKIIADGTVSNVG